jgi:hypothetical protein
VCTRADYDETFANLLHDPLIRLVMQSDGVTEEAMVALLSRVRGSLLARVRPPRPAPKLDMYGACFDREGGFLHRFFQRGVRVTGARDVLG